MNNLIIRLRLKNKNELIQIFKECDGDINDPINGFYINNASEVITVNAYCDEEKVFTCFEFPNYVFPIDFIEKRVDTFDKDMLNKNEIAKMLGVSAEAVRRQIDRTLAKLGRLMSGNEDFNKECCYGN